MNNKKRVLCPERTGLSRLRPCLPPLPATLSLPAVTPPVHPPLHPFFKGSNGTGHPKRPLLRVPYSPPPLVLTSTDPQANRLLSCSVFFFSLRFFFLILFKFDAVLVLVWYTLYKIYEYEHQFVSASKSVTHTHASFAKSHYEVHANLEFNGLCKSDDLPLLGFVIMLIKMELEDLGS